MISSIIFILLTQSIVPCINSTNSLAQGSSISGSEIVPAHISQVSSVIMSSDNNIRTSFYRTDSIFSFRSEKGYFPSLMHNFGEQATAPLHFSARSWLLTGASAGITALLIHFDDDIDNWATVQKQKHEWVNKTSPVITAFGSNAGLLTVAAFGSLGLGCICRSTAGLPVW